jgi:hypothetical protein
LKKYRYSNAITYFLTILEIGPRIALYSFARDYKGGGVSWHLNKKVYVAGIALAHSHDPSNIWTG